MTPMHDHDEQEERARLCLRCSAPADGDYCAPCRGTFAAATWQAWDTLETYEATIGPVPPRPDDETPAEAV